VTASIRKGKKPFHEFTRDRDRGGGKGRERSGCGEEMDSTTSQDWLKLSYKEGRGKGKESATSSDLLTSHYN